jgi:hypothetical protein
MYQGFWLADALHPAAKQPIPSAASGMTTQTIGTMQ